jgi:hypothetical protein
MDKSSIAGMVSEGRWRKQTIKIVFERFLKLRNSIRNACRI